MNQPPLTLDEIKRDISQLIQDLGLPNSLKSETPTLVMMVILGIEPGKCWQQANNELWGIFKIMKKLRDLKFKDFAANTRETIRDECVGVLLDAELVTANPDDPSRPKTSSKFCYQVNSEVIELVKAIGTSEYTLLLDKFKKDYKTYKSKQKAERESNFLRAKIKEDLIVNLSPGGQNPLIKAVIEDFKVKFKIDEILYIDNTVEKARGYAPYFNDKLFDDLGMKKDKFLELTDKADIILYKSRKKTLIIVEAVKSGGEINVQRRDRLLRFFKNVRVKVSFVNAFSTLEDWRRLMKDVTWETHVWIQEFPDHMIHFNGDKYLFD